MSPKFQVEDLPDLTGRVYLVTGGNTGIGKQTISGLVLRGAKVYMGARSAEKAEAAIADIRKLVPKAEIHFLKMDLARLSSVVEAAKEFLQKESKLHCLINNAGVMGLPYAETVDGYEIQWQTNYMSHWLLTYHLIPILQATSKASEPGTVRIVCLSSGGHMRYPPKEGIRFEDTRLESENGMTRYGQSKLGNVLHAKQLHAHYGPKGKVARPGDILTASVNPGNVETQLTDNASELAIGPIFNLLVPFLRVVGILTTIENSCLTSLFAAASADFEAKDSGGYAVPFGKISKPSAKGLDVKLGEKLWDWTGEELREKGLLLEN